MTDSPISVCLIQHSTRNDNLGVGALTVAEVEILRRIARDLDREIEITILDWKDRRPSYVAGPDLKVVDLDRRMKFSPGGFLALARRVDAVIDIGAGDSFADIYGTPRLRRMFWLKGLVHMAGTPLVMAPQTIGPFTKGWSRRLAAWTMRRSAIVASRDRLSTEAARELGIDKVIEASDVALRLPFDPPPPRPAEAQPRVGLNVSGLLMGGGYTGKNEFGLKADYPGMIRTLIRQLIDEGCEVHLVGHVLPETAERTHPEDDSAANRRLAEEFPEVVVAPHFATPSEAKSYIAGLDFFAGARMHACIAAFSSGVPVVPMAYSRKFAGLFGSMGYDRTVDCTKDDADFIIGRILEGFRTRDTVAREAKEALARGLDMLGRYESDLGALLAGKGRVSPRAK